MDILSEVLKTVQLEAALFYNAEFSAPWSYRSPESCKLGPYINHPDGHIVVYHLLIEGRAFVQVGAERLELHAGDIVIIPHGDAHCLENGPAPNTVDAETELQHMFTLGLKVSRYGGGGEVSRFVCGFIVFEPRFGKVFLSGLPPVFKVSIRGEDSGGWLEDSIRYSIGQANSEEAGATAVLTKLSEALFVETLRRYTVQAPEQQTGWLAGARDPAIGNALTLMHREPARSWTLAELARHVGLSRSVFADRFRQYLGQPPLVYLTRWRLLQGAHKLSSTDASVAEIAADYGYDSESAFNRAFKRFFGSPPARYRSLGRTRTAKAGE